MCSETCYELSDSDLDFVESCTTVVRRLLVENSPTPQQIIGIALVLATLERLPLITPDVFVVLTISRSGGDDDFREMNYFDIEITDYSIAINRGGSVYSKGVGSDSFSSELWRIDSSGVRYEYVWPYEIFDHMNEMINVGVSLSLEYEFPIPEID